MAQKNINIGTGELTGDGETLRGAFSKIEDNFTELYGSSGGLTEIVQDTTPQLGGNLDMNGFDLVTTELNKDIILETHGTGDVLLKGDKVGIGSVNQPDTTLHLKDTNSVITLQRTADANTPGLSFQNSNGNVRGVIKLDGTGGTSNEIFMETYDGATQAERFRVTHTGAKVTGKILYSNSYASIGDFPTASSYEGLFVYDTGGDKPYVADSNGWVNILTENDSIGSLSNVNTSGIADGNVLVWNSSQGRFNPGTAGTSGISNVVEDTTPELGGDLNVGGNSIVGGNNPINLAPGGTASINLSADETITTGKILYSNMYAQLADLPNATTYHGMFAHVHATGAGYFAHGGNWIQLANYTDLSPYLPTANLGTNVDLHLNQASAGNNQVLSWDGADYAWVNQSGGGSGTGDISFSASDILTDATTMNFKVDVNDDDSGFKGYYFYGGTNSLYGYNRFWSNGSNETAHKMVNGNNNQMVIQIKADGTWFILNEDSGNHLARFYNYGNGNNAHINIGVRHADARVRITDHNGSLYYALPSATPNLGDVLTASDGSGTLAWSAPSGGSSSHIGQGNSNVTVTDTGSDGTITFDTEGTDRWQFTSAGHLLPYANASYDIGSADYKVRHLFLSDNSLKFVDSSDTVHELSVASGFLQFKGKDLISSESTQNVEMNVNGAGLGISIGTASTSGTTISIGAEVNNTSVNMYGVTEFGARAIFNRGVHEKFLTITGATGVVDHNTMNGHVFYHTGAAANWTANFTNLTLAQEDATNIAIIIDQGNTAYMPTAVQIGGVAQTIVWQGNSTPTGTDNGKNVVSFTILNDGGTYVVLGQSTSFGGV